MNGHFSPSFYREHIEPRTVVRSSDPGTSHEAALGTLEFAANQREKVLVALAALGGLAGAEQIGARCGLDGYAIRKRLPELQRLGRVHATAQTRTTASGRKERLWALS